MIYFNTSKPGMQTVFDLVQADYIIHAMIFNTVSLGSVAICNIFDNLNETFARVISLSVFSFILSHWIRFSGACLIWLASIHLLGIIEELNGETIKHINGSYTLFIYFYWLYNNLLLFFQKSINLMASGYFTSW